MNRIVAVLSVSLVWIVTPFTSAQAQDAVLATPQREVLTNASITELKSLGLGDDVIVEKIKSAACRFDVSMSGLKALKDASVSDTVIRAMIAAMSQPVTPPPPPPVDLNDPASPHEAGIWLCQEAAGKKTLSKIEPSMFTSTKAGVPFFAVYGQTSKAKAVMFPAHASLQLHFQPTFYFYFEKTQSGLSDANSSATSPEDFALLKMEVRKDKDERRVVIGKVGLYGGARAGYDAKDVAQITYAKVSPGIFKVAPQQPLVDGEYCFLYSGSSTLIGFGLAAGGPSKGFCFGMDSGLTKR